MHFHPLTIGETARPIKHLSPRDTSASRPATPPPLHYPVQPLDPDFERKVADSASRQPFLQTIGARLTNIAPGAVEFTLPFRSDLTQQHGFVHAGVIATLADVASGYAAYSLMPPGAEVLTVEFKLNLLQPARGDSFVASARVLKAGKTLTVASCDVFAVSDGSRSLIATMLATIFRK